MRDQDRITLMKKILKTPYKNSSCGFEQNPKNLGKPHVYWKNLGDGRRRLAYYG